MATIGNFRKGRAKYTCSVCGKVDYWGEIWFWYGSFQDLDEWGIEGVRVYCSGECRQKKRTKP